MTSHPVQRTSARQKSLRHGHPCLLHLWWAAARAVIFCQMVDDVSSVGPWLGVLNWVLTEGLTEGLTD